MRVLYIKKGIEILKDAVSIPGVFVHYLIRGSMERGAKLWSPGAEEYAMLKGAEPVAVDNAPMHNALRGGADRALHR